MKIGAVDLFCGVGGLTYGLRKSNIDVVAGIDVDSSCEYAYTKNNKSKFIQKSIEDVKGIDIKRLLRGYDVKVLVGCAPCQPFSNHQKEKSDRQKHKDWRLLYEFGRLIKEAKPHIVSMENVPELRNEQVFQDFIKLLEAEKYNISFTVVNASDYGVPQRRRRLILLASKKNRFKKIGLLQKTNATRTTVQTAIGALAPIVAGSQNDQDKLHISPHLSKNNLNRIRSSKPGGTWRDWPHELLLECHKKEKGRSYGSVYGRMSWDDVAPTITTQFICYGTGRFGHPTQDRALSLREGAILQTFPPDYNFIADDEPIQMRKIARHIGNAVPPNLGAIIGKSIIACLPKKLNR